MNRFLRFIHFYGRGENVRDWKFTHRHIYIHTFNGQFMENNWHYF